MSSEKSPNALKTIGEVAEDIDVATHVLRFWESKFHQIKPQKRRGRRYYRPEDVVIITQIKSLLYGQGYTIRGVQKYLSSELKMKAADNKNIDPASGAQEEPKKMLNIAPNAVPFAIQMPQQQVNPFSVRSPAPQIGPNVFPGGQPNPQHLVNQNSQVPANGQQEVKIANSNGALPGNNSGFSNEDIKKLKGIYDGLCGLREELKQNS